MFLTKPFSVKKLIAITESVIAGGKIGIEKTMALITDEGVLASARLLFIEPNNIIYCSKLTYFRDSKSCKGRYQFTAAFTEQEALEKLVEFKPDIILSDISVFRLYKLNYKMTKLENPVKDIILYGFSKDIKDMHKDNLFSFIGSLFDPVTAMVNPAEMDKLGQIVRKTAIEHGLYIKVQE